MAKGLGVSGPEPYYVVRIEPDKNVIVVGHERDTFSGHACISEVHWIGPPPEKGETVQVRIRYKSEPAPAIVMLLDGGKAEIVFERPQRSVTPGQTAVVYRDDEVLGCGIFDRTDQLTADNKEESSP